MLLKGCLCVDFAVEGFRLAILSVYLTLLMATAVSVVWIFRKQRSSMTMEIEWPAPIPFLEYKSLESTINNLDENAFRQPVEDLCKVILDQRRSEVVDAYESTDNINFSKQVASLECTADGKLTAPQNKFELSAFTEQSKLFGNDFTAPSIGDNSGRIDVNFSAIQQVGKDDLDEIAKDLERGSSNMSCHSLFSNGQNMSDHIESELNIAHTFVKNDEDMSITDTVHSPVQEVSKSASKDKKVNLNNDWVTDKENIAMKPYAAPCESGKEPRQVVVFDVKRSTLLPDKLKEDKDYRQTLLPNSSAENPQSFVLDVNDDLPNSIDGMLNSKRKNSGFSGSRTRRKKNKRDENEIPDTVPVHKVVITPKFEKASKRETIVFNDSTCNICITQTFPVNMMLPDKQTQQKCRTSKYEIDSGFFSDTQTFPINVILPNNNTSPERQQTVLHEDLENPKPRRTIVYEDDTDNISVTQALLSNILPEKVHLDNNKDNNEAQNIIITQSFSNNIVAIDSKTPRHRTIVYENDTGNISITQVKQQLKPGYREENPIVHLSTSSKPRSNKRTTNHNDKSASIKEKSKNEKKSVVYDEDPASICMALAIIANNYLLEDLDSAVEIKKPEEIKQVKEKRIDDDIIEEAIIKIKTIACDQVDTDESYISIIGARSTNIIGESTNERKTIAYDDIDTKSLASSTKFYLLDKLDSAADITKPIINYQVIDCDVFEQDNLKPTEDTLQDSRKSTVFVANKFDSEPSMTMGIATVPSLLQTEKRRTVICNHKCNISMKYPTPAESISDDTESLYTTKTKFSNLTKQNLAANPPSDIALQAITTNSEQLTASISEQINLMDLSYRIPTYVKVQKANNRKLATPDTQKVLSLPVLPASAIVMPVHPRSIDKLPVKLITSRTDRTTESVSEGDDDSITKESLSNISYQGHQRGTYDKSLMAILESDPSSDVIPQDAADSTSTESMFYIMKDSEFVTQTDRKMNNKAKKANTKDEEEQVVHLQRQLSELKAAIQNSALLCSSFEIDKRNEHFNKSDNSSTLSDTQELLDLISNFTGSVASEYNVQPVTIKVEDQRETIEHKRVSVALNGQSKNLGREDFLRNILSQTSLTCEEKFYALKKTAVAGLTCEEKFSPPKKTAVSGLTCEEKFSPPKKTAVAGLTYEEKFSALKKTAVGGLTCEEKFSPPKKTAVGGLTCEEKFSSPKKTSVAGLTYEEKCSPLKKTAFASLNCEEIFSPLKKTAFGETSYMYESIEKVMPTRFKDVSDGIKELMLDLLKPVSNDNFQLRLIDGDETQNTSTHSVQIQTDLSTSSHNAAMLIFDHLNPLNNVLLAPNYSKEGQTPSQTDMRCGSEILKKISKGNNYEAETFTTTQFTMTPEPSTMQDDIYVYQKDDRNSKKDDQFSSQSITSGSISLNQSTDAISVKLLKKISIGINCEAKTFTSTQFTMMPEPSTMQDDIYVYQKDDQFSKKDDQFSSQSTLSGSFSLDQSADAISRHLRNEKVNSSMQMRKNEELSGASLLLELVEDASQDANRALISDSNIHKNLKLKLSISPHDNIQVEVPKIVKAATLSGISIRQRFNSYSNSRVSVTNSKTWIDYSPSADKHEQYSPTEEMTPTPITKNSRSMLSSPDDPTKSLRTEEMFFIFVDHSFRPADPVFDRLTSVNNILNSPTDLTDAHKNDPRKTDQTLFASASSFNKMSKGDYAVDKALTTMQNTMIPGQHTDNTLTELLNTLHALVNDDLESKKLTSDKAHSNHSINSSRPVLVDSEGQTVGRRQYYRTKKRVNRVENGKKQTCIPSTDKHKTYSPSVKETRKPITKIQNTNPKPRTEPSTELYSADDFTHSMAPEKYFTGTNKKHAHSSKICEKKSPGTKETSVFSVHKPCPSVVLDFDLLNPLNNILLAPTYYNMEARKYSPRHTDETLCGSRSPVNKTSKCNDNEVETVTTTLYTRTPEPKKLRNIYLRNYGRKGSKIKYML